VSGRRTRRKCNVPIILHGRYFPRYAVVAFCDIQVVVDYADHAPRFAAVLFVCEVEVFDLLWLLSAMLCDNTFGPSGTHIITVLRPFDFMN
jgi:hypothetical protein